MRSTVGVDTRVDGKGSLELDNGKVMRLVRIRQVGAAIPNAPVIRDARAEAETIFEELGIGENVSIDPDTGEVLGS